MKKSRCLHFRQILTATFLIPFLPCHGSLAPKQAWSFSTKLTNHTPGVKATHWRKTFTSLSSNGWVIFPEKYISQNCIFFKKFLLPLPVPDPDLEMGGGGGGVRGYSPPKMFSALRASLRSKNKGEPGLPGRSPGSATVCLKLELFCSKLSSCSVFFDFELIINI